MELKRYSLSLLILMLLLTSICYFNVKEAHAEEENIINGGFETGDFSNWTYDGRATITEATFHAGSYSAYLKANSTLPDFAWIEQSFSSINKTQISSFGFWHKGIGESGCDPLCCWLILDGGEDVYIDNPPIADWTYEGLLDDIPENRNVTSITFSIEYYIHLVECEYWIDDVSLITGQPPQYYFNFDFLDFDSEDVELHVDWALWNSTHDISYTEGDVSLDSGTYYLKSSKYGRVINTTTLDTATYGNSTIDINLNMKRHQSCSNGFIVSNDTISSITVHVETPQLLNFTIDGNTPVQHGVGVPKNASYVLDDGVNMTDWTYLMSPSHIYWDQSLEGEVLIDSHDVYTSPSDLRTLHPSSTTLYSGVGQRRIASMKGYKITKVKFELDKYGAPQGNVTAILMDENYVIKAESDKVDMSIIPTVRTLFTFNFSTEPYVSSAQYSIGVIAKEASVLDGSNYISVSCDGNGGYEGEDSCKIGFKSDRWWYTSSWDCTFYVYGQRVHNYAFVFPSTTGPVVGPHGIIKHRLCINVRLNGEWLKGCHVSVEGGPDNRLEWGLTDVFGRCKFRVKTGHYVILANYEDYWKKKPIYISSHMTIGIDLTESDYFPDGLPEDREFLGWVPLPELDFTSEVILVMVLPLLVLLIYGIKKAVEGPKRKWRYSYLK